MRVLGPLAVASRTEVSDANPPTRNSGYGPPSNGVGDPGETYATSACRVSGLGLGTVPPAYAGTTFVVVLDHSPAEPRAPGPLRCPAKVTLARTDGRAAIVAPAQTVDLATAVTLRWAVTVGEPGPVDLVAVIEQTGCAPGTCAAPLPVLETIQVSRDPVSARAAEALDTFADELDPSVVQLEAVRPHVPTALHLQIDLPDGPTSRPGASTRSRSRSAPRHPRSACPERPRRSPRPPGSPASTWSSPQAGRTTSTSPSTSW